MNYKSFIFLILSITGAILITYLVDLVFSDYFFNLN